MATLIPIFRSLLSALILTILIESVPLLFLSPRKKWLSVGLLCNVLTNPLLNCLRILFYSLYPNDTALTLLTVCLEILIVFAEGCFYSKLLRISNQKGFYASLLCNCISYLLGLLLL